MSVGMGLVLMLSGCAQRPLSQVRADANYFYFADEYANAQPFY